MDAEELFLQTLDDLKTRVDSSPSEYEVLGIAALLRKLLLDDHPLLDRVNQKHRLKIRFTVADFEAHRRLFADMGASFWTAQDGLDPETAPPGPLSSSIELSRDQFLGTVVMASRGHEITIRDVIKHGANVAGSVHLGNPTERRQAEIAKWAEALGLGGYPVGTGDLQAVGRVVLRAVGPLRDAVKRDSSGRSRG